MLLGALGMGGTAGFLYYRATQNGNKLEITKVPKQNGKASSAEKKISSLNVNTLQAAQVPPILDWTEPAEKPDARSIFQASAAFPHW